MKVKFRLAGDFHSRHNKNFREAQSYVDNQMVKNMKEFIPVAVKTNVNSGKMRDSVIIQKPGRIVHADRNARREYYTHGRHHFTANPKAQPMWFEVTKAIYGTKILSAAAKIAGGRIKK